MIPVPISVSIVEREVEPIVHLTASQIHDLTVEEIKKNYFGRVLRSDCALDIIRFITTKLCDQATIRGLPLWVARDFAKKIRVCFNVGKMEIIYPDDWLTDVNNFLMIRVCHLCNFTIPGCRHSAEDCRELLAQFVMEL